MTIADIDKLTKDYADARQRLAGTVVDLEDKIESLKRQYLPGIKVQVAIAAEKKLALKNAIEDSKSQFQKPRTIIMHGIKVGFQKGKGKIEWEKDAEARIVLLIEKHFPDMTELLIKTTKKPKKKALGGLSVADLKKLGIQVEATGDSIVIEPTDSNIEKLVDRLLKEKTEETGEDEEAA